MKIKLQNILAPIIYIGLFFITNYFNNGVDYSDLIFFSIGIVFGTTLMYLDELVLYKYYLEKPIKKINLVTRSLLFIISLFPLGLFLVTSTGSELGVGLFLGIITTLLLEFIEYRKNVDTFDTRFMFQLKKKLNAQDVKIFTSSFAFFTLIFILLVFFMGR